MVLFIVPYIFYMAANVYATWWTILPASVLVGLGAAPLWAAKCTYLTALSTNYAYITGEKDDIILNRFFGIFFMAFQSCEYEFI